MSHRNAPATIRVARWLLALVALALGGYATAGLIGGALPGNAGWRPPARGVLVFVESNGIHTGFVVPKVAAGVDWRDLARAQDIADPRYAGYGWLAIGWGEQDFYLKTRTWADLRLATVLGAARGSDRVLLHLEHLPRPVPGDDVRPLLLREDEYRRLAAFIRASTVPHPRRYPGYDRYDTFLTARGHYSAVATCNAWTGDALRHAGVRVGRWTPFAATVIGWF